MQFFNARNSFKHISRSTSGTFAATQLPYSLAWVTQFTKMRLSTGVVFLSFILALLGFGAVADENEVKFLAVFLFFFFL